MGKIVYIGKESIYFGKNAMKILANLKNFGIGRMLTQHKYDAFPEPTFYIVKRVQPSAGSDFNYGKVWCEAVIRGKRYPGLQSLDIIHKPDFRLVPKDQEHRYLNSFPITNAEEDNNIEQETLTLPPLMEEYMRITKARMAKN